MTGTQWGAAYCLLAVSIQMLSALIAISRCAKRTAPMPPRAGAPAVSIVRPLCGIDPFARETLASTFALDYPAYEILFCLADGATPGRSASACQSAPADRRRPAEQQPQAQ